MNMMLRSFFDWISLLFRGGTSSLRPYESACLLSLERWLSHEARRALRDQMSHVNLVQRSPDDSVVSLFFSERNGAAETFAYKDFLRIGRVFLTDQSKSISGPAVIIADVIACGGKVVSIEFSKNPRELSSGFEILKSELDADPESDALAEAFTDLEHHPTDDCVDFLSSVQAAYTRQPLAGHVVDKAITAIDSALPLDYVKLLRCTNGCVIGAWRVRDAMSIESLRAAVASYYILADTDKNEALVVQRGSRDRFVYYIDADFHMDDPSPPPVSESLVEAIRLCSGRGVDDGPSLC